MLTSVEALAVAAQFHRDGDIVSAGAVCAHVIINDPANAEACHLGGLVALAMGESERAVALIRRALAVEPLRGGFQFNLGLAHRALGNLSLMLGAYRRALAANPSHSGALNNLGEAALRRDGIAASGAMLRRAILVDPSSVEPRVNLALALGGRDDHVGAVALLEEAGRLSPGTAEIWINLAGELALLDRREPAARAYRRSVTLAPASFAAMLNLGLVDGQGGAASLSRYRRAEVLDPASALPAMALGRAGLAAGRPAAAIGDLMRAVRLMPWLAEAHRSLAFALRSVGEIERAVVAYKNHLCLEPASLDGLGELGGTLHDGFGAGPALSYLQRATAVRPTSARSWANLALALHDAAAPRPSITAGRRAIALDPVSVDGMNALANLVQQLGDAMDAVHRYRRAVSIDPTRPTVQSNMMLAMACVASGDGNEISRAARTWGARFGKSGQSQSVAVVSRKSRKLKVGYLSSFLLSSTRYLGEAAIRRHDPERIEAWGYISRRRRDVSNPSIVDALAGWKDIDGVGDDEAAEIIRKDDIDILVDLCGHTPGNRLGVFARRAAAVQMTWVESFFTTGVPEMDYFITDRRHTPEGGSEDFSERLLFMPQCRFVYQPPEAPEPAERPAAGKRPPTFGCFNNLAKLSPETVETWAGILKAVPDSRLILKWWSLTDAAARGHLIDRFSRQGVDPGRLDLRGFSSHRDMLLEYGDVDVALDPFPYSGGVTTCEALWMGVPVVTLAGRTLISRQSAAFLDCIGVPELAGASREEYLRIAVEGIADRARLDGWRRQLRGRLVNSPLMNVEAFARDLDEAYLRAWLGSASGTS